MSFWCAFTFFFASHTCRITRVASQPSHLLPARAQVRRTQRVKFMRALAEFCDAKGTPLAKIPAVSGRELDLHLLYTQVRKRGGYEKACEARKWAEIAEGMNMHDASTSHLAQALKKHYQQLLLPYERCVAGLDPRPPPRAVAPQAAGDAAPTAADDQAATAAGDEAAASAAAEAAASAASAAAEAATSASAAPADEPAAPMISSGGGLMAKRGLGLKPPGNDAALPAVGQVVQLTSAGPERSNAEVEEVIAYEPPLPGEELCEVCNGGGDNDHMMLCDRCSCGFHSYCLTPPLASVPAGEWFCSACLKESFGFGSTRVFKFFQFERQARHLLISPQSRDLLTPSLT